MTAPVPARLACAHEITRSGRRSRRGKWHALYRLTEVTYPDPETDVYTYDNNGNRLSLDATAYTYDAADQLLSAGGVSYGYDENGNQTSRGADTFEYDHENRLIEAVVNGVTSTPEYNGDGLRTGLTVDDGVNPPVTTSYLWDVNRGPPVILQDGANIYVYGLDLISATDASGNQTYFTYDGLGSTTDLTDGSGTVTDQYTYDVFGALRSHTGSSANYWQFTGEQSDADSGLYFLRARYYEPATGRFLTPDAPCGQPKTQNLYAYTENNPVNFVDPPGRASEGGFKQPTPLPIPGLPTPRSPIPPTPTPTGTPPPMPRPAPTPVPPPGYQPPTPGPGVSWSCVEDCVCDIGPLGGGFLENFVCGFAIGTTGVCAFVACRACIPAIPATCAACYACLEPLGSRVSDCVADCPAE